MDLPPLNALSLELATVLDEISGVGYHRAIKGNGWIKKKHVLNGHYSREPYPESSSLLYASEKIEVSGVVVDPVSFDRISGFNIFSATLFPDRKDMDADEVGSLGCSFGSDAEEDSLPMDSLCKLAGFYQILGDTQDQLSDQVALKDVSQFVDHVAPMLSYKDVSALQSILERLNVKSEEQIIHLKHPDSFADERDDEDAEIIWITSEASSETTDELKAVETASFVSDTFSVSEYVPKESSGGFDENEIIWITSSQELVDIDERRTKAGTAHTAAQRADYDHTLHKETHTVPLEHPGSSDEVESEFIWITSPEEDLTHVGKESSTSKLLQTSYEDQSKSYKTNPTKVASLPAVKAPCKLYDFAGEEIIITPLVKEDATCVRKEPSTSKPLQTSHEDKSKSHKTTPMEVASLPATKAPCKLYDFAGEEVIITPLVNKIPGSDDLPCLTEHTAVKSMKTSDENQSSTSAKQQDDASCSSSPATTCKLYDSAGEDVIITPLDTEEENHESDWNLSYTPQYPPFVNRYYWRRPMCKTLYEERKKLMKSCFARDSELSVSNPEKLVKKNQDQTRHKEQLGLKNSFKEVVLHLDHSVDHEGSLKSPITDESVDTVKPYNNFLQNQSLNPMFKNMPSDSSNDDTYVDPKSTASGEFDVLNLEKSSGFYLINDSSNEMHLNISDPAVEESQYLSEVQKDSVNTSAKGSILLESSFESGPSHTCHHHFHKEDDNKETTSSTEETNKLLIKQNLYSRTLRQVEKYSGSKQNENFDDSEIKSGLQENEETIKDSNIHSENLSLIQPPACKDFIKPEDPVATKFVQNFHHSGKTPAVSDDNMKDNSDYASLHNQQDRPTVSNQRGNDLIAEEVCNKFSEMPSEDVFPTSSLLFSSCGSNEIANESSSTDEVKKKKSAQYWMKKIFVPKKFYKKNLKGIR